MTSPAVLTHHGKLVTEISLIDTVRFILPTQGTVAPILLVGWVFRLRDAGPTVETGRFPAGLHLWFLAVLACIGLRAGAGIVPWDR